MIPRVVLAVSALAMVLLAWPRPISFAGLVGAGALVGTAWAVGRPGSVAPLAVIALAVLDWLISVPDPGLLRSAAFGVAGFLVHSAAALAHAGPPGFAVQPALLVRWFARAGALALLGVVVVAATGPLAGQRNSAALVLAGLLAATVLAALPVLVHRRRVPGPVRTGRRLRP